MRRLWTIVMGGGISGLACARELSDHGCSDFRRSRRMSVAHLHLERTDSEKLAMEMQSGES